MSDKNSLQQLVERLVSQVLESHIPYMRDDLVRRVVSEVDPLLHGSSSTPTTPDTLLHATSSIYHASAQKEVLSALLDSTANFCGRAALFVVRGGSAIGWQGRGFASNDAIKNFALDLNAGLATQALQERRPVDGPVADVDRRFVASFGAAADNRALMLPLIMKDKVAALLHADAGTGGKLDRTALELLVHSTGSWLELLSFRRGAPAGAPHESAEPAPAPEPGPGGRAQAEPVASAAMPKPVDLAFAAAAGAGSSVAVTSPRATPAPQESQGSVHEEEVHRKARRFAKLLVDEIKLYNKGKVEEGKRSRDLYDRLKDDIDKSRSAYEKRYGSTVAGSANYFLQELVRILADNDRSLLGSNFPS
jgi:hypothetical protein